jgi:hypothetical protein
MSMAYLSKYLVCQHLNDSTTQSRIPLVTCLFEDRLRQFKTVNANVHDQSQLLPTVMNGHHNGCKRMRVRLLDKSSSRCR